MLSLGFRGVKPFCEIDSFAIRSLVFYRATLYSFV